MGRETTPHEHRYEGRGRDDVAVWDCSCGDTMGAALERTLVGREATPEQACRYCACAITMDATGQYVHSLTGATACDLQAEPMEDDRG